MRSGAACAASRRGLSTLAEQNFTLDADSFARLEIPAKWVFITENEINFLAFPARSNSLIIVGSGYGFEALQQTNWLRERALYYWVDIDTYGFAILNQLRRQFAHVQSRLMDCATPLAFRSQWGHEESPSARDLSKLAGSEQALYDDLHDQRLNGTL